MKKIFKPILFLIIAGSVFSGVRYAVAGSPWDNASCASGNIPPCQSSYTLGEEGRPWKKIYVEDQDISGDLTVDGNLAVTGTSALTGNITTDASFASGKGPKYPAPAAITPATSYPTPPATPGTGSQIGTTLSKTVAGNPTATFVQMPAATAIVGKTFVHSQQGSNPTALVPVNGDSVNALTAGTPYPCPAGKVCTCFGDTTTNIRCSSAN